MSRERRHVSRGRHVSQLRALFSSDVEEVTSVVSDNPGLYTRSTSMSGINGGANVRAKNILRYVRHFHCLLLLVELWMLSILL